MCELLAVVWTCGRLLNLHQEFDVGLSALHLLEQQFERGLWFERMQDST